MQESNVNANNPGTSPGMTAAIPPRHHQNPSRVTVMRERHYPVHRQTESEAAVSHDFCAARTFISLQQEID